MGKPPIWNTNFVLIFKFREKFKWHGLLASGPRQPIVMCPGQCAPMRTRRHRGGSATARHLMPTLLADHYHLPSMCAHAHRRPYPLPCRSCSSFEHFHSRMLVQLCSLSVHIAPTAESPASPHLSTAVLVRTHCLWVGVPSLSHHMQREVPGAPLHHPLHPPWAPPIDNPHQPSFGLADQSNSFTRAPLSSSTSSPTTSTPPPVQHRRSPLVDHHCRGATTVVSLFLSLSPAGKGADPCLSLRPKGPRGLGRHDQAGQWPIGLSPFQQCPFTFSFEFNSKLNSNLVWTLEIYRDLNKFDKIINSIP
jgi:hypothetical protein